MNILWIENTPIHKMGLNPYLIVIVKMGIPPFIQC